MSHLHRRLQYATAPGILCTGVYRYDPTTGTFALFDAASAGGWTLGFRMWREGSTALVVDAVATQPAVGQLLYTPTALAVVNAGSYRGVFSAVRDSDSAVDIWPVQTIEIAPVVGGAP